MHDPVAAARGGCLCGRVRFAISAEPMLTMACHCRGCQKLTASAFSLSILIPAEGFTVTQGETVVGALHGETRHLFCDWCKSWLFTRWPGPPDLVNVRATMLDDAGDLSPFIETCTREKLAWATTPAAHSFAGFPAPTDYPRLLAAFAAR